MRNLLKLFLILGLLAYVGLCGLMALSQRSFIYHPQKINPITLEQMGVGGGLTRWKNAAGDNIGWKRMSTTQPAHGQLLVTYGNGGDAVGVHHYADAVQPSGWDVYILEYPGYADRPGEPTEANFFRAADDGFAALPTNCPTYLLGESLGSGVASYLAGAHPQAVKGVVLLAPFNTLVAVGQHQMPWLPVPLLMIDRFNSVKHLQQYHGPLAVFVGTSDRVVPERYGLRLYESYDGPKKLWEFPGDDHGDVFRRFDGKWPEVAAFWVETDIENKRQ